MNEAAREIVKDIRALKIQGARNIANAGINALVLESDSFDGTSVKEYKSALLVAADEIASARPTEPMLKNYLRFVLSRIMGSEDESVEALKERVRDIRKRINEDMVHTITMLRDYGASLIHDGMVCYTHCHSSTVTGIFKEAYDDGKDFYVVVSETRPRYQGVKTAKELAGYGIPTTLAVDSAAHIYIKRCDAVFVGADAITASGNLINKVGTAMVAHFAYHLDIPFYSAAELYKFDHLTKWGMPVPIEQRDPDEVLKNPGLKNLKIENPAFDVTPAKYITAYITEKGIIPPQAIILLSR
ncbi:MAG: translation initiation factor eIF-2B [Candidatus Micrarchaeia archaeon]